MLAVLCCAWPLYPTIPEPVPETLVVLLGLSFSTSLPLGPAGSWPRMRRSRKRSGSRTRAARGWRGGRWSREKLRGGSTLGKSQSFLGIYYVIWQLTLKGGYQWKKIPCINSTFASIYICSLRSWRVWKLNAAYYPVTQVKTSDLDPKKNRLVCCHPHGILCFGVVVCVLYFNQPKF